MAKKITNKQPGQTVYSYPFFFPARLSSIIAIILLLASIGFLYAKNQELEELQRKQTPTPTQLIIPTVQPEKLEVPRTNTIKSAITPTSVPAERRKVQTILTTPLVSGTYYCYEDKVNFLTNLENQIKVVNIEVNNCTGLASGKAQSCTSSKCSGFDILIQFDSYNSCQQRCYDDAYKECKEKGDRAANLVNQLIQVKNQYCP